MKRLLKSPVVFDGRNIWEPERMAALGFTYWWSYYDDRLAIEFTDERGSGRFRITDYSAFANAARPGLELGFDKRHYLPYVREQCGYRGQDPGRENET